MARSELDSKRRTLYVGDHMTVRVETQGLFGTKTLSDGTKLTPGTLIGVIDFANRLPYLTADDNLITFVRSLHASAVDSLSELARLCEQDSPLFAGVEVFGGISHIAGSAAIRLGFDVFEANPVSKFTETLQGLNIAWANAHENDMWKRYAPNFKPARWAYISRKKLIAMYGTNAKP